jgi:hypothetical protein
LPRQLSGDDEPAYDRRRTDRLVENISSQLHERIAAIAERVRRLEADERIGVLEREGSRGLAVLAERVRGFEASVQEKVRDADRTHEDLRRGTLAVRDELDALERRVKKLEDAEGNRVGFQTGLLRLVGPYASFVFGVIAVAYALWGGG